MRSTSDDGSTARQFLNVHFLMEQQLRILDDLDQRGADRNAAHDQQGLERRAALDLLQRLMRQDEALRACTAPRGPLPTA